MDTSDLLPNQTSHHTPSGPKYHANTTTTPSMMASPNQASSLLFERSPTLPSSPTPKGKKHTESPTLLHPPSDDEMEDNQPPTQLHPAKQSHPNNHTRRPLNTSYSEGDVSITHAQCRTIGRPISLHDHAIAFKEKPPIGLQQTKGTIRSPLDKFTKGNMPKVHVVHSMSTLDSIDINQLVE